MKNKFYITTPIYYASGKPHIGHAFATLYADVLARWHRQNGEEVFFSTGMDEHGTKIAGEAEETGKAPQEFVDKIAQHYIKAWQALDIKYDGFIRTTSEAHKKGVYEIIKKLKEAGDIYEGVYEGLYCVGCEKFLTEKDLIDGLCPDHKQEPEKIKENNYFFNLKKYLPEIKEKIKSGELKVAPESRKNEILSIINSGIPDFSISREKVKWGILFPGNEKQTIYVWVEALVNYLTVLGFPAGENYKKFWPADAHIIGAEINKFHSIFWPALLLSAGIELPKAVFAHGLFTIDGQKISKTIGNIIDPLEMIEQFGADAARYLILSQFSAIEHGDIKQSEFIVKYNADLANGLGNLFERVFTMVLNFGIDLNKGKEIDLDVRNWIEETEKQYNDNLKNFLLFDALKEILLLAKKLDKYIDDKKPWVMNKNNDPELEKVLVSLAAGAEKIAEWIEPFMPSKALDAKNYIQKIKSGEIKKEEKLNLFHRNEFYKNL